MTGLLLAGAQLARLCWERRLSDELVLLPRVANFEGGSGFFVPIGYGHLVAGFTDFFE